MDDKEEEVEEEVVEAADVMMTGWFIASTRTRESAERIASRVGVEQRVNVATGDDKGGDVANRERDGDGRAVMAEASRMTSNMLSLFLQAKP